MIFSQKIIPFQPESQFYMFFAFFEVNNICFVQNFQIFSFLAIRFPLIINFIPRPPAAKKIIKSDYFWYLWTGKVHNIYLRISSKHQEVI